MDGELIGELPRRSIRKFERSVKSLRDNNHICYVSDMNSFFKPFRCSTCDTIFSKTGNLERHLITCSERVKHICPNNVYQLRETLFEKLDSFNIPHRKDQKLFKNLAIFEFESICVKQETNKETETANWIGKQVPISVSVPSNLKTEPIFLCNSDPRHRVSSFISALEGLATQSKAQTKLRFIAVETAIKIKLSRILGQLNHRHSQREQIIDFDDDEYFNDTVEEKELSTQFLQMQRNQLIDLQEHFGRYCNTLPLLVLTVQSMISNGSSLICCQFLLTNDKLNQQLSKKLIANQFVSSKFGDVLLLDNLNFLGGATSLHSFLKAYKREETKRFPL